MKSYYLYPALGIILAGTALVILNEYSPIAFVDTYAYIFIVAAMIGGLGIARWINRSRKKPS